MRSRSTIRILSDYYLPGYKAGGPVRTLSNMVEHLGDRYDFSIFTRDRDMGDSDPYPCVANENICRIGKAFVRFLPTSDLTIPALRKLILSSPYGLLYLNSFFSLDFTIKPLLLRRLGLLPDRPVIIAPRGEFSSAALAINETKKRVYICCAKYAGLYRDILWQASSQYEADDIRRVWGEDCRITVAPDLLPKNAVPMNSKTLPKMPGYLRVVFLSRISEMKNLDFALQLLCGVTGQVQLDIWGPLEDMGYWKKCQGIIRSLPDNVSVEYRGEVPHEQVAEVLTQYDLFLLPTRGENFGHAIVESLMSGCPVLISDRTPWRGLGEHGAGWDIPLEDPALFRKVLKDCIEMNDHEMRALSISARKYGTSPEWSRQSLEMNCSLFDIALNSANESSSVRQVQ